MRGSDHRDAELVTMEHTTCTEDRIKHALDRCLDGLRQSPTDAHHWNVLMCAAGQSMNRWSLEELVKRDPENFIILLQQILKKTKEVQELCQYELVAPLAIMFFSTLLQTPYCPPHTDLLHNAMEVFRVFLTWPEPYSSVCKTLLTTLQLEIKVPGISFHRLVREEQALGTSSHCSKTVTVLLMNPGEVPVDFLTVAEQLSRIKHAFQSALGTKYPLQSIHVALQDKDVSEVNRIYSTVCGLLETAASLNDPVQSRAHVVQGLEALRENMKIPASNRKKCEGMLQTLPLPTAKCHMFYWEKDNFDVLNTLLDHDLTYMSPKCEIEEDDEVELYVDDVDVTPFDLEDKESEELMKEPQTLSSTDFHLLHISSLSTASKDSMFSTLSITSESYAASLLSSGVDSDFCDDLDDYICPSPVVDKCSPKSVNKTRFSQHFQRLFRPKSPRLLYRAKSLGNAETKDLLVVREKRSNSLPQQVHLRSLEAHLNTQNQALRHVCFRRRPILSSDEETDHVAGKVARAYSSLRKRESACPHLTRAFKLQFYFVPVKRDISSQNGSERGTPPSHDATLMGTGNSTNDIALCQQTSKTESDSYDSSYEQRLPILADLVLYYCRYAARPTLIQLYQAELTFASGEKRTEVFVHSLELGHTAGTRAVKAMGTASKRFGIDGDREAVPLTLDLVYNRVVVSGRSQWKRERKVCTSVNLTKACKNPEELDSKMEYLQLSMTEVIKRQSGKSKKGFNQQLSLNEVKVDKVQITGDDNTFAVCLDQDEKKILQSVTRCEISVCYKTDSSSDWTLRRPKASAQIQPLNPTFCSLLCLPIVTFSGALP
ncbi:hypothetical protein WMY93_006321 [Mugilogobius chulae]|uniref:Phosphoinositide 3-kinase regulatory subunit 5 n=1 Tax=Mugilogobius chulae TaxID=88201 RepID=A0AAW0PNG3_9GOBI